MKKLFVLILLLFFSLPVLAKEVRLTCTVDWHDSTDTAIRTYTYGFDEAAGTVLWGDEWHSIKAKEEDEHASYEYFITEQKFGHRMQLKKYPDSSFNYTVAISRIDGTYSRSNSPKATGTCVQSEMPKRLY